MDCRARAATAKIGIDPEFEVRKSCQYLVSNNLNNNNNTKHQEQQQQQETKPSATAATNGSMAAWLRKQSARGCSLPAASLFLSQRVHMHYYYGIRSPKP